MEAGAGGPPVRVHDSPDELAGALAAEISALYAGSTGTFLLGCPTGRTFTPTYRALADGREAFDRLVVVLMDEYLVTDRLANPSAHFSCAGFAERELRRPLGLEREQVWLPDPADPSAYDRAIAREGGVDLFLVASGASDGHVAFRGPGSDPEGTTSVVELAETTRRDNLATFPQFASLEEVPTRGVSVGLGTIASAHRTRLALTGADKRPAARELLARSAFDAAWPASIVYRCADAEIWLDAAAAA
jgi:glucosamine-6-phosphate deaminase